MDTQILIQYVIVLLSLIILEGLLSADNAIVLAVMVRHLPYKEQKNALIVENNQMKRKKQKRLKNKVVFG